MQKTIAELAGTLGGSVVGTDSYTVTDLKPLDGAGKGDLTFAGDEANLRELLGSRAEAAIVGSEFSDRLAEAPALRAAILVEDAHAAFVSLLEVFHPPRPRPSIGISPRAFVDPTASIGEGTNIYPGAYIAEDAVIGEACDVLPGVYVGAGCRVGDRVTLHANAVLYPEVVVESDVIIHAGAVIGCDGFGYRFEEGRFIKIPHVGTVHVESDVEVGAGTTIDRAMVGTTRIGAGTKLDDQVMIAHNCRLGRHNAFASQVGLAGSVTTGEYVRCGGQVGVRDHTHLGAGCTLAATASVHKDVPEGASYLGTPARPQSEQVRILMAQTKLPEMRAQIRKLEKQLARLTAERDASESEAA